MRTRTISKSVEILLVEDSKGDIGLIEEVFEDAKMEAIEFLSKTGKHKNAIVPDLILLDLNLPKKDGREVLEEVKSDDELKNIPIGVLTTSKAEEDILRSYNLQANAYIIKPVDFDQFIKVVKSIESFWLEIVKLPSK